MVKIIVAVITAALIGIGGTAVAEDAFNSSKHPTLAPWMNRPCIVNAADTPRLQNCYWNNTMGLTNGNGDHIAAGFWIRKMPHQPLVCYFMSPDDYTTMDKGDRCFSTTGSVKVFMRRVFNFTE